MENILNITNGDSAVGIMKEANIPGRFLPWRDVLHDGPVPENLPLEELSEIRTQFIIDRNWGTPEYVKQCFLERDNELKSHEAYEKVILWFEHDLYDQLQILQILDWFYQNPPRGTKLSIICTSQYLGRRTPDEMKGLFKYEEPITEKHLVLSKKAWSAFRSPSPEKWHDLLNIDTSALPFLRGAIIRLLEEYPNLSNGLSRTAQQALKIILQGEKHPGRIFAGYQETEDRIFLGDSSFWVILQKLLESTPPLLKLSEGKELISPVTSKQELTVTPSGKEVLACEKNWLEMVDLDRWIGGVHLKLGNIWSWNSSSGSVAKKPNQSLNPTA